MLQQPSSVADRLAQFIAEAATETVESIAEALDRGLVRITSSSLEFVDLPHVSTEKAREIAAAFGALPKDTDPRGVALALRMGSILRKEMGGRHPNIEVAWTGPEAGGPLVRPTALVIQEMLQGARDAGQILIVGYSLTVPDGTAMGRVVRLLQSAASRRVQITMVLHRDESAENKNNILRAWSVFVRKPRILTWDPPRGNAYTKLHAKVLVVDRFDALVGSANLTFHGLESNIELGLRVRGPQAAAIAERFDHLMASGVLTPWEE